MIGLDHLTFEGSLVLPTRTRYRLTRLILVGCMKLNSLLRLAISGLAGRLIGWSFGLLATFFGVPGRYCITFPAPPKKMASHTSAPAHRHARGLAVYLAMLSNAADSRRVE